MRLIRKHAPSVHADVDERLRRLASGWALTPEILAESTSSTQAGAPLRADHWSRRSWRAFVLLLGAIALVGGWLWWQAQPREVMPVPGSGVSAAAESAATAGTVVVHVAGAVRKPGVVTLPAGARVADAIDRAGGARAPRYLESVNLARLLVDGEQIVLGQAGGAAAGGGKLSLGSATATELEQLPGVGPVLAQRIMQWRTEHGPFRGVDELNEVSGVGDSLMEQLRPLVVP